MHALDISRSTVERTRRRFVEGGLPKALNEDARPGQRRKLDGRAEAHWVALACSERPDSQARWSMRLLADKLVELGVVESISHEAVRQTLKKTRSNPGRGRNGVSRQPTLPLWPKWKRCWTCTNNLTTPKNPWCALMSPANNSSKRCISQPPPHLEALPSRISSISVTARAICSCSLSRWSPGATSTRPNSVLPRILPTPCSGWPEPYIPICPLFISSWTLSIPTPPLRCIKLLSRLRPDAFSRACAFTTPPNMARGSTWLKLN